MTYLRLHFRNLRELKTEPDHLEVDTISCYLRLESLVNSRQTEFLPYVFMLAKCGAMAWAGHDQDQSQPTDEVQNSGLPSTLSFGSREQARQGSLKVAEGDALLLQAHAYAKTIAA